VPEDRTSLYDLIVFDFDGTLCDSADVKTEAFYELYLPDHGDEFATMVLEYHLTHAGISRYEKIRYVERELLTNDPDGRRVDEVAQRFSDLVEEAVVAAPLFDGVSELLEENSGSVPFAIASATPTEELRRITDRKGISQFFTAIEGSPRTKAEILTGFSHEFTLSPARIVMVGDQPSDADGATSAGTDALVISPPDPWTETFQRVDTFVDAAQWILERMSVGR
jgi:phosphoglycolate phosphatase-like HAD superfamily hydrolase